jgi:hypothetical protein
MPQRNRTLAIVNDAFARCCETGGPQRAWRGRRHGASYPAASPPRVVEARTTSCCSLGLGSGTPPRSEPATALAQEVVVIRQPALLSMLCGRALRDHPSSGVVPALVAAEVSPCWLPATRARGASVALGRKLVIEAQARPTCHRPTKCSSESSRRYHFHPGRRAGAPRGSTG